MVNDNLLDDGLLLLNYTTEEWKRFFKKKFNIKRYEEIGYPKYGQYARIFFS